MPDAVAPGESGEKSLLEMASFIWLNFYFWTAVSLVTLLFLVGGTLYTGLYFLVVRNRQKTKHLIRRTIRHYAATALMCGWPLVRMRFVDHAPKDEPPFVLVSNHRSSSDAFIMACLPFECIEVLNNWVSEVPVIGQISYIAGYLTVRKMPFTEFEKAGSKLLSEGCSIIAFPEGTRSGLPRMGMFHGSSLRLAQKTGTKIVPLAISGNENIPKRGSLWLRRAGLCCRSFRPSRGSSTRGSRRIN